MNKKTLYSVIIFGLFIVIVVFAILNKQTPPNLKTPSQGPETKQTQPAKEANDSSNSSNQTSASGANSVQSLIASMPQANATQAELTEYSSKVFQASTKADTLDITACTPKPSVIYLNPSQSFTVVNHDTVAHKLTHGTDFTVNVAAGESKAVKAPSALGIYGYSCDSKMDGIFFISK